MSRTMKVWFVLILLTPACGRSPALTAPPTPAVSFSIVSGSTQSAPVNTKLAAPLRVRVLNPAGQPVPNFVLNFVVTGGGGHVFGGAEETNAQGYAEEQWTLGPRLGPNTLEVRTVNPATGVAASYGNFTATGTAPTNVVVVGSNATGVFKMNADGSGFAQITKNSTDVMPDLSPDHSKVAFVSALGSTSAVYVINVDGTNRHVISSACSVFSAPHFSPDGNLVLFTGTFGPCGPSDEPGVQVVDLGGGVAGQILQPADGMGGSSWSADGQGFVFGSNENYDGINLYGTSNAPRHPDDFSQVTWVGELTHFMSVSSSAASPDGLHIAFVAANLGESTTSLYVMDTDGSNPKRLTAAQGLGGVLSYSPDGTLIAIDRGFMNADGTGYTVVAGCPCQFAFK